MHTSTEVVLPLLHSLMEYGLLANLHCLCYKTLRLLDLHHPHQQNQRGPAVL
jgi:hypothetical protein